MIPQIFYYRNKYMNNDLQKFQFYNKYARWNNQLNRRETWSETIDRTIEHLQWLVKKHTQTKLSETLWEQLREGMLTQQVIPIKTAFSRPSVLSSTTNVLGKSFTFVPTCGNLSIYSCSTEYPTPVPLIKICTIS